MKPVRAVVVSDIRRKPKSKYGNKKVVIDGIKFDSMKEGEYYLYLRAERKAGRVLKFKVHEPTQLLEPFVNGEGKKIRGLSIRPDFIVWRDGELEFVDIKGGNSKWSTRTSDWNIKWKILQYQYRHQKNVKFTIV